MRRHLWIGSVSLVAALACMAPVVTYAQGKAEAEGAARDPISRYRALADEYAAGQNAFYVALSKAKDAGEAAAARALNPRPSSFAARFLEIARSAPESEGAFAACCWILSVAPGAVESDEACALLARHHADHKRLPLFLPSMTDWPTAAGEAMLRAIRESSTVRENRAQASATLASVVASRASREALTGKTQRRSADGAAKSARDEAAALFKALGDVYGDLKAPDGRTFAQVARASRPGYGARAGSTGRRDEDRRAEVGRLAPEISGRDTKGRAMKLSSHRGSVVVLSFWGDWCPWCHDIFAFGQAMKYRFPDKPVVLLGVNTDGNPDQVRHTMSREDATWRSFLDGGPRGPISSSYQLERSPTTLVLDRDGIIRYRMIGQVDEEALSLAVTSLLDEPASDSTIKETKQEGPKVKAKR